jgi:hypothetical protein
VEHETEVQEFIAVGPTGSQRRYKASCSCNWDAPAEADRASALEHIRRHLEAWT